MLQNYFTDDQAKKKMKREARDFAVLRETSKAHVNMKLEYIKNFHSVNA